MKPTQTYAIATRVLACSACGAPLDVAILGGAATCGYCGATSVWERRPSVRAAPVVRAFGADDAARLARLRAQAPDEPMPPAVRDLTLGRVLNPMKLDAALDEWLRARSECLAGAGAASAERLYALTRLWHEHGSVRRVEAPRIRAFLESALELLVTDEQTGVLRATLASEAVLADDPDGAAEWLAGCDPASEHLASHSAYVVACALVATAHGRWDEVRRLLGDRVGDVPLTSSDAPLGAWLVANALERSGRVAAAADEVANAIARSGPGRHLFVRALLRASPLRLCVGCRAIVRRRSYWATGDEPAGCQPFLVVVAAISVVMGVGGSIAANAALDKDTAAFLIPFGVVIAVLGAIVLVVGGVLRLRTRSIRKHGIVCRGTVVHVTVVPATDESPGRVALHVAVELPPPAAQPVLVVRQPSLKERGAGAAWLSSCQQLLEPGTLVSMLVDPSRLERARLIGAETW